MNLPGFYPSVYIEKNFYTLSLGPDLILNQRNPRQLFALTDTFFWRAYIYLRRFNLVSVYIVLQNSPNTRVTFSNRVFIFAKKEALPYIEVLRDFI